MIDYLTFIEELKKIRETNNTRFADPSQTNKVIDKTNRRNFNDNYMNDFNEVLKELKKNMVNLIGMV